MQQTLNVLLLKDDAWTAQCLEHDVAAQGETIREAIFELTRTLAGELTVRIANGEQGLESIPRAPHYYWKNSTRPESRWTPRAVLRSAQARSSHPRSCFRSFASSGWPEIAALACVSLRPDALARRIRSSSEGQLWLQVRAGLRNAARSGRGESSLNAVTRRERRAAHRDSAPCIRGRATESARAAQSLCAVGHTCRRLRVRLAGDGARIR